MTRENFEVLYDRIKKTEKEMDQCYGDYIKICPYDTCQQLIDCKECWADFCGVKLKEECMGCTLSNCQDNRCPIPF